MTAMILCFTTHFPDLLLWVLLIVLLGGIALFILSWIIPVFMLLFFVLKYLFTGRFREFCYRFKNDPTFLTYDKKTGKFIW